mgnify:CR=1 FL=1
MRNFRQGRLLEFHNLIQEPFWPLFSYCLNSHYFTGIRFSKDRKTAFANYSAVNSGSHKKGTLAKNGFVIASYGAVGAERLDEIAKTFTINPHVYLIDNTVDKPIQSLSAFLRDWVVDVRLSVYGDMDSGGRFGYAFGVLDSGEASAMKK